MNRKLKLGQRVPSFPTLHYNISRRRFVHLLSGFSEASPVSDQLSKVHMANAGIALLALHLAYTSCLDSIRETRRSVAYHAACQHRSG
jgi:hypothetical protein